MGYVTELYNDDRSSVQKRWTAGRVQLSVRTGPNETEIALFFDDAHVCPDSESIAARAVFSWLPNHLQVRQDSTETYGVWRYCDEIEIAELVVFATEVAVLTETLK